jgi:hypothetical protein
MRGNETQSPPPRKFLERARVSRDMGMWWPERKRDEAAGRLESLAEKRNGVLTWLDGSAKDAALRALDDLILEAKRARRSEPPHTPPDTAA